MWDAPSGAWTREIPDHGTQGVSVPAVLSRTLPVVGNSESESPRYATLNGRPSSGQMRRGLWGRRYVGGARSMDGARFGPSEILFRRAAPARNPRRPRISCDWRRDAKHPVSSMLNEKPVPCSMGNNDRVFTDYGNQDVAVPAVLSCALPVVGNSESESSESALPVRHEGPHLVHGLAVREELRRVGAGGRSCCRRGTKRST